MASREKLKREAREAREAKENELAGQRQRKQRLLFSGVLVIFLLAGGAIGLLAWGGKKGEDTLPGSKLGQSEFHQLAQRAGCFYRADKPGPRTHTVERVKYPTNPPHSGPHHPDPASDGEYRAGGSPPAEKWVHTLEHGRIIFQYRKGAKPETVQRLRALYREELKGTPEYHKVLMENNTGMRAEVGALAWAHTLTCQRLTPAAEQVLRAFALRRVDKAPELIP